MMSRRRMTGKPQPTGLVEEPCTLVYTLLNPTAVPYEHFSLIVRSLHKYMVEEITEHETARTIHVKLGYQASIKNAFIKLGPFLSRHIFISKLSQFVKDEELPLLDDLRRRYGFGYATNAAEDDDSYYIGQNTRDEARGLLQDAERPAPKKPRIKSMPTIAENNTVEID